MDAIRNDAKQRAGRSLHAKQPLIPRAIHRIQLIPPSGKKLKGLVVAPVCRGGRYGLVPLLFCGQVPEDGHGAREAVGFELAFDADGDLLQLVDDALEHVADRHVVPDKSVQRLEEGGVGFCVFVRIGEAVPCE